MDEILKKYGVQVLLAVLGYFLLRKEVEKFFVSLVSTPPEIKDAKQALIRQETNLEEIQQGRDGYIEELEGYLNSNIDPATGNPFSLERRQETAALLERLRISKQETARELERVGARNDSLFGIF